MQSVKALSSLFNLCTVYICMNPFIYATKHEGVKQKLAGLMVWRKPVDVVAETRGTQVNVQARNVAAGGTQQSHI